MRADRVISESHRFTGNVRAPVVGHTNVSRVEGTVWMASDGTVRWRSVSVIAGQQQWGYESIIIFRCRDPTPCRFEGFQVGGVGSAMGVIGIWTGFEHEPEDPAGESLQAWLSEVESDLIQDLVGHGKCLVDQMAPTQYEWCAIDFAMPARYNQVCR